MTSRRLMVSKTCKMEFENMTMSDIKFELHRISRKEMANEWKQVLKTALWRYDDVTMTSWWLFLSFSDDFWHLRLFYAFWAKNHRKNTKKYHDVIVTSLWRHKAVFRTCFHSLTISFRLIRWSSNFIFDIDIFSNFILQVFETMRRLDVIWRHKTSKILICRILSCWMWEILHKTIPKRISLT